MREILDPVSPKVLRPVFKSVFRQWQRGKALEAMTFLDGHYLLALDSTGYFSSKTMHCASCLPKVHRNGLRRVPGGVGEAGQQAHALGAHESTVL